jgi:hypothetical protein
VEEEASEAEVATEVVAVSVAEVATEVVVVSVAEVATEVVVEDVVPLEDVVLLEELPESLWTPTDYPECSSIRALRKLWLLRVSPLE